MKQEDGKKCLACCKKADILRCAHCGDNKSIEYFNATMVTFPAGGVVCKACQDVMKDRVDKKERKNWFTCRGCRQIFPAAASSKQSDHPALPQLRFPAAPARRMSRPAAAASRKWHEKQVKGKKHARYCLRCRRK